MGAVRYKVIHGVDVRVISYLCPHSLSAPRGGLTTVRRKGDAASHRKSKPAVYS